MYKMARSKEKQLYGLLPLLYLVCVYLRVVAAEVDVRVYVQDVASADVGDRRSNGAERVEDSYKPTHVHLTYCPTSYHL